MWTKLAWIICITFMHADLGVQSRSVSKEEDAREPLPGISMPSLALLPLESWLHRKRDWTDPEIAASPIEIIKRWEYSYEEYNVTTEDGYILSLIRIPHGRNLNSTSIERKPVIYMQHGLESSCVDWIANLPDQSAAFIFADLGFDVWMGNFRGNTYSMRHVNLSHTQREFWRFSWDEMAHYDLPALINTTVSITDVKSVYYVGHSMGTTTMFAKLSQDPNFAKMINHVFALAPVSTVTHMRGPGKFLSPFSSLIEHILSYFGINDIFPTSRLQKEVAKYFCGSVITEIFCNNLLIILTGPESKQLNDTRMPVYLSHTPAGTSTGTVAHFAQLHNSRKFQMYDYGTAKLNEQYYGQKTPPEYDVSRINTPISLYWGGDDYLADPADVEELTPKLRNLANNVYLPHYNHMDFIWGLRAASEVYKPIYNEIMADFSGNM